METTIMGYIGFEVAGLGLGRLRVEGQEGLGV